MKQYSIYGGCLQSDVPFPALPAGDGRPAWRLRRVRDAAAASRPAAALVPLGEDRVDPGVSVRLFRHPRGLRLAYDDTGVFDVLDGGARIEWYPGADPRLDAVRLDVLGRVLPAALHEMGSLCLHGSAVGIAGHSVAFLAPKHHGKSTLARAIARAGGRVLSDDVVALDVDPSAVLRPGVTSVRLWRDAAARLGGAADATPDRYGKLVVSDVGAGMPAPDRVPLRALYALTPVPAAANRAAAVRMRLSPVSAAMALLPHARLAALLGRAEAARILDRIARLTASTPVYALEVARDFDRLDEAAHTIRSWHAADVHTGLPARRTA